MVFVLTGTGLLALIAGLIAIVAGLPILEFSYGNTLITAGAIGAGCGLIVVALAQILRELRRQSSTVYAPDVARADYSRSAPSRLETQSAETSFPPPPRATQLGATHDAPSRRDAVSSRNDARRARHDEGHVAEQASPSRPNTPSPRNLMFRKPAHNVTAIESDEATSSASSRASASDEASLAPAAQRVEGLWKRRRREPGSDNETSPTLDLARGDVPDASEATVLKSGTVDGLAYTLYSDGSIEAQLTEGIVRFDSIEALRAHLDRPA